MDHEETVKTTGSVENSENIIINRIYRYILKKWRVFLVIGLVSAIAGYIYASLQKPVYESYLSFALDEGGSDDGGGASGALGLAAQFGISLGGSQDVFTGDNILEIMLSRRVVESVLLSVDTFENKPMTLIEFYLEKNQEEQSKEKRSEQVHFYPGVSRNTFSYAQDSVLYETYEEFKKYRINARRPDKRMNIYELMVNSHFEKFSKVFTDKLIEETNRFYTEIRSKKAKGTLDILEKRVPDMKSKLDASISGKAAIQDANMNTAFENAQVPIIKKESNAQVYGAAYAEMFKNLELARFQYLRSIPLMQVIDEANYPMNKIKAGKLITSIIFAVIGSFLLLLIFIGVGLVKFRKG